LQEEEERFKEGPIVVGPWWWLLDITFSNWTIGHRCGRLVGFFWTQNWGWVKLPLMNSMDHFDLNEEDIEDTSSTAQGGGGSFKNRKPIGEVGCCESRMAERSH